MIHWKPVYFDWIIPIIRKCDTLLDVYCVLLLAMHIVIKKIYKANNIPSSLE